LAAGTRAIREVGSAKAHGIGGLIGAARLTDRHRHPGGGALAAVSRRSHGIPRAGTHVARSNRTAVIRPPDTITVTAGGRRDRPCAATLRAPATHRGHTGHRVYRYRYRRCTARTTRCRRGYGIIRAGSAHRAWRSRSLVVPPDSIAVTACRSRNRARAAIHIAIATHRRRFRHRIHRAGHRQAGG
jgi:hypothetical protein